MAYYGTTAASTDRNPPICLTGGLGQPSRNTYNGVVSPTTAQSTASYIGGANLWLYTSSDPQGTVQAAGYFTDGKALGMKHGDLMFNVCQTSYGTSPTMSLGVLVTTNSTAGFNIAIGSAMGSS